jgi:hypothetical protein
MITVLQTEQIRLLRVVERLSRFGGWDTHPTGILSSAAESIERLQRDLAAVQARLKEGSDAN